MAGVPDVLARVVIVAAFAGVLIAARWAYLRWRERVVNERPAHPRVPSELLADADRTWLVFTTPYCASCGPAKQTLATSDPAARIVTVDATRQPDLADAFHVRTVPNVLLANGDGEVQERLVGASAVRDYAAALSPSS